MKKVMTKILETSKSLVCQYNYMWYDSHSLVGNNVLGSEVDKPSKISIKISNRTEYIQSDIQNIEAPRIYNPII